MIQLARKSVKGWFPGRSHARCGGDVFKANLILALADGKGYNAVRRN